MASKSKNQVEEDDLAKRIDELREAFPKTEPIAVKEEAALGSADSLNKSVGGEVTIKDKGAKKLKSQKEPRGKLFSRKKPFKVLEPAVDMKGTLPKKKGLSFKFSTSKKKNQLTVPITPVPEVVTRDIEPVNEKVLETYSLIEPYCNVSIVKDLDRGNIKYVVEEPKLTSEDAAQS